MNTKRFHKLLLAGLITPALAIASELNALNTDPILKISFLDGTESLISISDDLRIDFDSEHILIQNQTENPRIFHIEGVSRFSYSSYSKDEAGVGNIRTEAEPVINFSSDGISVIMPGHHSCHIFDINGSIFMSQDFDDSLFINSNSMRPGTFILQTDHYKTLKFIVR